MRATYNVVGQQKIELQIALTDIELATIKEGKLVEGSVPTGLGGHATITVGHEAMIKKVLIPK
ncbi:hypothetical protein [Methylobacter sp.]|uniref:hypothetical protein n=1 Tax=Methylobacter sp. TaxID=2051955 RepID=UPI0012010F95|nr:hypothetical protein [Methylobacter sp.]TAK59547.1 MAG: hypothetical protein EPO18_20510 [Methylobacter sp.]